MTKANSGLANFAKDNQARRASSAKPDEGRQRGKGDTVGITVRLSRDAWERLHHLALAKGQSLQSLAVQGFSLMLKGNGLPGID